MKMKNKRLKATTRKWELLIINLHAGTSAIKLHLKETDTETENTDLGREQRP
jgi:hypothetical protein